MKHFYRSTGILNEYEPKTSLANAFWEAHFDDVKNRVVCPDGLIEYVGTLVYNYGIHESLGGLGSCLTVNDWKAEIPSDVKQATIKALFVDFVEADYMPSEFLLSILHTYGIVRFNYAMSGLVVDIYL